MVEAAQNRKPVLLILGAVVASGVLALAVLVKRPGKTAAPGGGKPAGSRSRIWPEEAGPRVVDQQMISQDPDKSSIDLVERPLEAAKGGQASAASGSAAAGGPTERRGASAPGEDPSEPAAPALSASEKSMLGGLMGGDLMDPGKAAELGASTDGLWTKVMRGLSRYPKVMRAVLDNKYVVKGFFAYPQYAKVCSNPSAATNYLTDTKRSRGVTHAMNVFEAVMHGDPKTPAAVFGSKLAEAVMDCPSTKSFVKDPAAIGAVAQANPRFVSMMVDPAIMMGLASNPTVSAGFSSVQSSLVPPAR